MQPILKRHAAQAAKRAIVVVRGSQIFLEGGRLRMKSESLPPNTASATGAVNH